MRSAPTRVACFLAASLALSSSALSGVWQTTSIQTRWSGPNALGTFVRKSVGEGRTVCIEATREQASGLKARDANLPLASLVQDHQATGLRIVLRATAGLQNSAAAREAFVRAAGQWEALIQTPATIIVDVDFGPTLFGSSFDDDVVSATDVQILAGNSLYPSVRDALISGADSSDELALDSSLPPSPVLTDEGQSAGIATPSATLRALGLISRGADPNGDRNFFGAPPAIGFNSRFSFDFDASDGIDSDKFDFEAMAVHELGHVLGFASAVGQHEVDVSVDARPTIWDLFRVRPSTSRSEFTSAARVLSSGGEQVFYAGDEMTALSTGRPDAASGDGREASHWKDDALTNKYIGVMDPTICTAEHPLITSSDLSVLDTLGYKLRSLLLVPLTSGEPQRGGMPGPPAGLGFISHTQYSISVPAGATELKIDLNGNQDVDLFARFGQRVFNQGFHPESDYFSATDSGSESITITAASSPPLKPGTYYIAVANFGPGDAEFTVTGTIFGGSDTHPPVIFDLTPHLEGDVLMLDFTALDLEGDLARADVSFLDEAGRVVGASSAEIAALSSRYLESTLSLGGMNLLRSAVRANVLFIDRAGNKSSLVTVDFSKAEPDALTLKSASYNGSRLTLKVSGVDAALQLEVNGLIVAPPLRIKSKNSGAKLVIVGEPVQTGLTAGPNRIRVRNSHGWSNVLILDN